MNEQNPEALGRGEIKIGHNPSDQELAQAAVTEFFGENSRYPAHNQAMIQRLQGLELDSPGMVIAIHLHDIVDHGLVNPKNDEDKLRAQSVIQELYEKADDKQQLMYGIGCAISAATWESDIGESWRFAGREQFPEIKSKDWAHVEAAINKKKHFDIDEKVLKRTPYTKLDTSSLRDAMFDRDVEGLLIKAVELMDNLDNPPPDNPASTWRDCVEVLSCYAPALDLFQFDELSAELRGKALKYFYSDPRTVEKAQKQLEASLNYLDEIEKFIPEAITDSLNSVGNQRGLSDARGKAYVRSRVKTEGSMREKFSYDKYLELEQLPDGIGFKVVILDGSLSSDGFSEDSINEFMVEVGKKIKHKLTVASEGNPNFIAKHTDENEAAEQNYIDDPKESGYTAYHLALQYIAKNGENVPVEIQIVSASQEIKHLYDSASKVLYKTGVKPTDQVINDLEVILSRAENLKDKSANQELNVHTLFDVVRLLPYMETPFHRNFHFEEIDSVRFLVPHELSDLTKKIDTTGLDGDIIVPPKSLSKEDFEYIIGLVNPKLFDNQKIKDAISFLETLDLKNRNDGETSVLEGHLLPVAAHAVMMASMSQIHWESDNPDKYLEDTVIAALLHDAIEDTKDPEKKKAVKKYIRSKFGEHVADADEALSSPQHIEDDFERRTAYALQVNGNDLARRIKISDRSHNHVWDIDRVNKNPSIKNVVDPIRYFKKTRDYMTDVFTNKDSLPAEYINVYQTILKYGNILYLTKN